MEWIFLVSTLIGLATEIANNAGNAKYMMKANNNKQILNRLKKNIEADNISDSKIISTISSVIGNLNQMRFTLDPRVIKRLDNIIGSFNQKMNEANENINTRNSLYEQAVASVPDNQGGILGLDSKDVYDYRKGYDDLANSPLFKEQLKDENVRKQFEREKAQWDQVISGQSGIKPTNLSNINNVSVTSKGEK